MAKKSVKKLDADFSKVINSVKESFARVMDKNAGKILEALQNSDDQKLSIATGVMIHQEGDSANGKVKISFVPYRIKDISVFQFDVRQGALFDDEIPDEEDAGTIEYEEGKTAA